MVKDLSTLLRESAAYPPGNHGAVSDLTEVVRLGRSRVRRRRVAVVSGAVASVVAVAVAGALLAGGVGGTASPEPAGEDAPVGPVVHPADAEPGLEGRDHTVLTSYTNDNLDRANGQYLAGVLPDGTVLVKDGPHGIDNSTRWGLLDPTGDGDIDWMSEPPSPLEQVVSVQERRFVFLSYVGNQPAAVIYDRDSDGWSVPNRLHGSSMGIVQAHMGADNRIYYTVQGNGPSDQLELWSTSLDSPDEVAVNEGVTVGDFDVTGDELVYTATTNEPNDRITVRDLTSGEQRSFDPQSGDACNQLSLQRAGDHLVLGQYCGTTNGGESPVRDDRVQVIDLDGNPVVTVQGHGIEPGTVSATGFVVASYGDLDDRDGATYTWSFADGELRQVADSASKFSMPWLQAEVGPAGSDAADVVMWHEAVNDRHGARQVLAHLP